MGPSVDCAIVVPWRDHPELRQDFQEALMRGPMPEALILVDDGSERPIQNWWEGYCSRDLAILRFGEHVGYQRAVNEGVAYALTLGFEITVLLNNDVRGGAVNWLSTLVSKARDYPDALTGPVIEPEHTRTPDGQTRPYVDGWLIAAGTERLAELGPFRQGYAEPAYWCDNDLAQRVGLLQAWDGHGLEHLRNATAGPGTTEAVQNASILNRRAFMDAWSGKPTAGVIR